MTSLSKDGVQFLDEKGLTIGGYESAWLAKVSAYILEQVTFCTYSNSY
jgi:hypothetical protein